MKAKRRTAMLAKKAAKKAAYSKAGDSKYARKDRQNRRGNFGPRSPFRSVVTILHEEL